MSTITLLTVLQVISDRKTAILKDLERTDTDKRVKNADIQKPALYARIDECDKILNLLKAQFDEPAKIPSGPINRDTGHYSGKLFVPVAERTDQDALGQPEEGANGSDLVAYVPDAVKRYRNFSHPSDVLQGPDSLHKV